jgi:C4-dicarboxylate-specific signal transduction histidine kinase
MGTTLSIIAVVVLLVLLVVSVKRRRDMQAAEKEAVARAHTGAAEAQHERSERRRAGVRAAHAERSGETASDADTQRVGSEADQ